MSAADKRHMRTTLFCALALGCGSSTTAMRTEAAEPPRAAFEAVDADADEQLDDRELFRAVEVYYDVWDHDENGRLTSDELAAGVFLCWDRNRDDRLDREELAAGVVSWMPNDGSGDFAAWDADANGSIDRQEAERGVASARLFQSYDENGDGTVTDLELSEVVFHTWDIDGDERVDALEWRLD